VYEALQRAPTISRGVKTVCVFVRVDGWVGVRVGVWVCVWCVGSVFKALLIAPTNASRVRVCVYVSEVG